MQNSPPPHLIHKQAFTLIELSIVLVIIGLVIGGVLFGKDLIAASEARAQISQIREFNLAVRTFQNKYQCLPGDCKKAENFGFEPRGQSPGQGDGNGVIEGTMHSFLPNNIGGGVLMGEPLLFWGDLTLAGLIAGPNPDVTYFDLSVKSDPNGLVGGTSYPLNTYLPEAKIKGNNYIYVWSGGWGADNPYGSNTGTSVGQTFNEDESSNGINYFAINVFDVMVEGYSYTRTGIRVYQAFAIDSKIDDGLPQTGKIVAMFPNFHLLTLFNPGVIQYAAGNPPLNADWDNYTNLGVHNTDATPPSEFTCFDNGGVAGTQRYSMSTNQGNGVNCALSFQFE